MLHTFRLEDKGHVDFTIKPGVDSIFIEEIELNKEFRGKGLSRHLIREATQWISDKVGSEDFHLVCMSYNFENGLPQKELLEYYQRLGFIVSGDELVVDEYFPKLTGTLETIQASTK
jgi:GNAT superfamily N-acetyltransferase